MSIATPRALLELTSVRAFAAAIVVVFHMFHVAGNQNSFLNNLIADGHLGVDLFFILSGFILTHVYLPQVRTNSFRFGDFIVNRLARVYPLHLFMLLVFVVTYQVAVHVGLAVMATGQDWSAFPWHLLLLHAWGFTDGHAWNFPSWSVSAEFFAYLAFVVVLAAIMRMRPYIAMVGTVLLFIIASEIALALDFNITKMMYDFGIARIFFEFSCGVALYFVFETRRPPSWVVRTALIVNIAGILALSGVQADERYIVALLGVLVYLLACLGMEDAPNPLRSRVLVYLGEISYSTYMVHILVVIVAKKAVSRFGLVSDSTLAIVFAAAFLVIYGLSALLYRWIESPGRRFIRNYWAHNLSVPTLTLGSRLWPR